MSEGNPSTLKTAALLGLENLLNRLLHTDAVASAGLAELGDTVFKLTIEGPDQTLYLITDDTSFELHQYYEGDVATALSGRIPDFVSLLTADDAGGELINGGITVRGDTRPLLALQAVLRRFDVDWEAELAAVIGDLPAHQIGKMVRSGIKLGKSAGDALQHQLHRYLHEEGSKLPSRGELNLFYGDVNALREQTERIDARLQRLIAQRKANN